MLAGLLLRPVYSGSQARIYFGVAVSPEEPLAVLQMAVVVVARRVSWDARQVLADGFPIVKKGSGLMCCDRWILLFGERHAWCPSISFSRHRKVDGQRVPYVWI